MPLLQLMLGSLSECTREVDPEAWRRCLGIVTDGLRTRRDGPTPLEHGALSPEQTQNTMRTWRPARASAQRGDQGVTGRSSAVPSTKKSKRSLKNANRSVSSAPSRSGAG